MLILTLDLKERIIWLKNFGILGSNIKKPLTYLKS